jgi:hypothetical protein
MHKGFICGPRIYSYHGWTFEDHHYCGPHPLNKDGELRKGWPGRKFWKMYNQWQKLPPSKKERTRIGGGCIRI